MSTTITLTVQVENDGAADSLRNNLDIARLEHESITIRTAGGSFPGHVVAVGGQFTEEEWQADATEILRHNVADEIPPTF